MGKDAKSVSSNEHTPQNIQTSIQDLAEENRKKFKEQVLSLRGPSSGGNLSISEEVSSVFVSLYEQRTLFNISDLKKEVFTQYQNSEEFIEMIQKALIDENFARENFEKQAEVRVLGIQFIGFLAENGNEHYLYNTLENLMENLEKSEGKLSKGQEKDIEDLAFYVSALQKNSDLKPTLDQLGKQFQLVDSENHSEKQEQILKNFAIGLARGFHGSHSWDDINNAFKEQFPYTFSSKKNI